MAVGMEGVQRRKVAFYVGKEKHTFAYYEPEPRE